MVVLGEFVLGEAVVGEFEFGELEFGEFVCGEVELGEVEFGAARRLGDGVRHGPSPSWVKSVQSLQTRRHESGLVGQVFRV